LRQVINLERVTSAPDAYGTPVEAWAPLALLRAEVVQGSVAQAAGGAMGAVETVATLFRVRAGVDVVLADRVQWRGVAYNILAIQPIERERGLELRCEAIK
jgi:head-tail adaptor